MAATTTQREVPLLGGNDCTTVDTRLPDLMYSPKRMTLGKGAPVLSPQDRVGRATMRNLDIADPREMLATHARVGLPVPGTSGFRRHGPPDAAG